MRSDRQRRAAPVHRILGESFHQELGRLGEGRAAFLAAGVDEAELVEEAWAVDSLEASGPPRASAIPRRRPIGALAAFRQGPPLTDEWILVALPRLREALPLRCLMTHKEVVRAKAFGGVAVAVEVLAVLRHELHMVRRDPSVVVVDGGVELGQRVDADEEGIASRVAQVLLADVELVLRVEDVHCFVQRRRVGRRGARLWLLEAVDRDPFPRLGEQRVVGGELMESVVHIVRVGHERRLGDVLDVPVRRAGGVDEQLEVHGGRGEHPAVQRLAVDDDAPAVLRVGDPSEHVAELAAVHARIKQRAVEVDPHVVFEEVRGEVDPLERCAHVLLGAEDHLGVADLGAAHLLGVLRQPLVALHEVGERG
mmetsp:Transcript_15154/g.36273  ORF Transcript_15154/g.36273 Transcript_15154/m.36273 type:complete len:367 (-) Transcript_15154:220-1320(-)